MLKDRFLLFFINTLTLTEHHIFVDYSPTSHLSEVPLSTTSADGLLPISPINSPVRITVPRRQNYSSELLSCFGKERLACAVNLDFNRALDKYVGSGRLDKIVEILRKEAKILCTKAEDNVVSEFLNDYEPAVQVAHRVTTNLSSNDKDQLNFMDNLNDTNAERLFYLNKFGAIGEPDRALLQNSFNEVMRAFASGTPANDTSQAVGVLTSEELAQIQKLNKTERISFIGDRLRRCNITNDESVIRDTARLFEWHTTK